MSEKLHLSVSPHIHGSGSTRGVMLDVLISLLPSLIAGCIIFGIKALLVVSVSVAAAVLSEYLFNLILKRENTVGDLSAAVTGLILGLNVYVDTPIWQVIVGSVFAIIVVKCFFGGIGCNIVNPALTARVFMVIAFAEMAKPSFPKAMDAVSGATPLVELSIGDTPELLDLFLGNVGGAIGETSALAILIGFAYLMIRRVISYHIPALYVLSVFLFSFLGYGFSFYTALCAVLSGGLLFGAVFMATDYVTSPATKLGKCVYALFLGMITFAIRKWGAYSEGVSFAILLGNILNPYIESLTRRRIFGGEGK